MELCHALRIQRNEIVALVGAGGKTTAMFRLARELTARELRVVTTTTTRIFVSQMGAAPHSIVAPDESALLAQLPEALRRHGHVLVVGGTDTSSDKAFGIDPGWVERIAGLDEVDIVIIEADGARMRSFKAPAGHEPVIPECVTLVVPMAGIEAVGSPLDETTVHRPECVSALTGASPGETITTQMMARVLADARGGRQFVPAGARAVVLLNKVDTEGHQEVARQVARLLLEQPALDGVVLAATGAEDPALEVWGRTAAVVLAGGAATRFGKPKLLEPWGGTTILGRVLDQALSTDGVDDVIVVAGCEGQRTAAAVQDRSVQVVFNEAWATGQASSVRAGVAALPKSTGAAIFLLGDQPQVMPETVAALVRRHRETLAPMVVPRYRGQRGNPVLFDRTLFAALLRLSGDTGGRVLVESLQDDVEWLALDVPPLYDIDTPEDYRRYRP